MHIHPNSNLTMASLGAVRNEVRESQAKRAADVRRKLSSPLSELMGSEDGVSGAVGRAEERREDSPRKNEGGEEFGRLFSARA